MRRKIIHIDEEKCNGCGLCADACHESAIAMVNGKAKLLRDDYCDGLGDCLPACPVNAISFIEREAAAYNEQAVLQNKQTKLKKDSISSPCGLPGSQLRQWPVQIKLAPIAAPYYEDARLLIAADCTAYAYSSFHNDFIRDKITLIGCPKLDNVDYSEKLAEIIRKNNLKSITVTRMEVPCCRGIENAVENALKASGKSIPCQTVIITTEGKILNP